ncbi:MAG: ankyrin repeat domain-containing protein [Fimbriiglobus sp.]
MDDAPKPFERDYDAPKFVPKFTKPLVDLTLARDFVIFAHSDFAMTKKLLEKYPQVLNATVDWGGGDFESAIGGASHLGNREIAEYLLSQGARLDIFCATMLGWLDVVKGMLTLNPKLLDAKGPHGIPLMMHAKMGGKQAEATLAYLQSLKPAK